MTRVHLVHAIALASCALLVGCGGDQPAQGAGPGAAPATAVTLRTLEAKPIPRTSELIATVRSLRSTTIQPDVEGVVTRIFVRSGDRVRAGAPLLQISPDRQQAAVRSTEASRGGTQADVQYWRQQVQRLEALVEAGAISRQEFEQAQNALRSAEARLAALDAQVAEGRVELGYHRVTAPQAGTVGDVPIRQGDRVTRATIITTIDANDTLEAFLQVPLDRSPELRAGLPVQLLGADGAVTATNPITFVSPRVDDATQTVLVKAALRDAPPALREQQFVRARIVWSEAPGVTIPLTAVTRISGQYFCFVAEPQDGGLVARQRPLQVGELVGNDYVVRSGLQAGDRVVVEGTQKIGDGSPIRAE